MENLDEMIARTQDLVADLRNVPFPTTVNKPVFLGFDGYIDNLLSVVNKRHTATEYDLMESMTQWGDRINASAGASASIECILKKQAVGGFSCNVGKALATLCGKSGNVQLLGTFGSPMHLPIFTETMEQDKHCHLHSVGMPGVTEAYEFGDGKVMMVNFGNVNELRLAIFTG